MANVKIFFENDVTEYNELALESVLLDYDIHVVKSNNRVDNYSVVSATYTTPEETAKYIASLIGEELTLLDNETLRRSKRGERRKERFRIEKKMREMSKYTDRAKVYFYNDDGVEKRAYNHKSDGHKFFKKMENSLRRAKNKEFVKSAEADYLNDKFSPALDLV